MSIYIEDDKAYIDNDGFLEDIELKDSAYASHFKSIVLLNAIQLNREVISFYNNIKIDGNDKVGCYLGTFYEKCHKDYQSLIILASRGLEDQAGAMLRMLLEKVIIMKAISIDNQNLEYWIASEQMRMITAINGAMENCNSETKELLSRRIEEYKIELDLKSKDQDYKKKLKEFKDYKTIAEKAGMIRDYKSVYKYHSNDVHGSLVGVNNDLRFEYDNHIIISIAPNYDNLEKVVLGGMEYLIKSINIIIDYLNISDDVFKKYNKILDELEKAIMPV